MEDINKLRKMLTDANILMESALKDLHSVEGVIERMSVKSESIELSIREQRLLKFCERNRVDPKDMDTQFEQGFGMCVEFVKEIMFPDIRACKK